MIAQIQATLDSLNGLESSILRCFPSMTESLWPSDHVNRRLEEGQLQSLSERSLFIQGVSEQEVRGCLNLDRTSHML